MLVALYVATAGAGYFVFGNGVSSPVLCSLPRDNGTFLGLF